MAKRNNSFEVPETKTEEVLEPNAADQTPLEVLQETQAAPETLVENKEPEVAPQVSQQSKDSAPFEFEFICNDINIREHKGKPQEQVLLDVTDFHSMNGSFAFSIDDSRAHGFFSKSKKYSVTIEEIE